MIGPYGRAYAPTRHSWDTQNSPRSNDVFLVNMPLHVMSDQQDRAELRSRALSLQEREASPLSLSSRAGSISPLITSDDATKS